MGEKEIKPADPKPDAPKPADDHPHTQERPGTGSSSSEPDKPKGGGGGGGKPSTPSSGSSASGHVEFEDGYKMGRDTSGNTFLEHPDGGRATWDPGSQTWTNDATGKTPSNDWTQGHRPTDFGPQR